MFVDLKKKLHQDNLKAEIFHRFKLRFLKTDFNVLCEYKENNCRFDLLVYNKISCEVVCLIEVRRIDTKSKLNFKTRKHIKYSAHGCWLFYISEYLKIDKLLDDIEKLFNK